MLGQKQHVKYRVTAFVQRLCLNKRINFETKITWKRNVNKVQTDVVLHQDCQSVFQQPLELELNFLYNANEAKFQPKFTEFSITVIYQGKIKSGGHVKYDAAEVVNKNFMDERVRLPLTQCPDPEAYLDVVFSYEVLGDSSRSLFNQLSMLNPVGFEQDLSQIDFQEEEERRKELENIDADNSRQSLTAQTQERRESVREEESSQAEKQNQLPNGEKAKQYSKINNILDKFESMSRRFSNSHKSFIQDDHNSTKHESQPSCFPNQQEEKLRCKIAQLQRELSNRQELISEYQKKLLQNSKYITTLQNRLQAFEQKENNNHEDAINKRSLQVLAQSQHKFRTLYEQTLAQLQQLKAAAVPDANFSKQDVKFNKFVEQMQAVNEVPQFETQHSADYEQKLEDLERENVELQTKIASMSHNIAQIFNAAYDFGGAKLLDYLQGSIGLIEHDT